MNLEVAKVKSELEAQLVQIARQMVHNDVDHDAMLAAVKHQLDVKIDGLSERVSKLEHANGG